MTQLADVLAELDKGPATSRDIADETGLHQKHAAHYLAELTAMGLATRSKVKSREPGKRGAGHFIYTRRCA